MTNFNTFIAETFLIPLKHVLFFTDGVFFVGTISAQKFDLFSFASDLVYDSGFTGLTLVTLSIYLKSKTFQKSTEWYVLTFSS